MKRPYPKIVAIAVALIMALAPAAMAGGDYAAKCCCRPQAAKGHPGGHMAPKARCCDSDRTMAGVAGCPLKRMWSRALAMVLSLDLRPRLEFSLIVGGSARWLGADTNPMDPSPSPGGLSPGRNGPLFLSVKSIRC